MTTEMRLDKHAYRGPPRRIGSSWSAIESNPPSVDAWSEHNKQRNWNWRPKRKHSSPRPQKSQEQQAADLLAKLLART